MSSWKEDSPLTFTPALFCLSPLHTRTRGGTICIAVTWILNQQIR